MCMYAYIYIYICTNVHIYIYIHTYSHVKNKQKSWLNTCKIMIENKWNHDKTHLYMYIYTYMYIYMCINHEWKQLTSWQNTCIYIYIYTCIYTCVQIMNENKWNHDKTHVNMYIHIHVYIHVYKSWKKTHDIMTSEIMITEIMTNEFKDAGRFCHKCINHEYMYTYKCTYTCGAHHVIYIHIHIYIMYIYLFLMKSQFMTHEPRNSGQRCREKRQHTSYICKKNEWKQTKSRLDNIINHEWRQMKLWRMKRNAGHSRDDGRYTIYVYSSLVEILITERICSAASLRGWKARQTTPCEHSYLFAYNYDTHTPTYTHNVHVESWVRTKRVHVSIFCMSIYNYDTHARKHNICRITNARQTSVCEHFLFVYIQ